MKEVYANMFKKFAGIKEVSEKEILLKNISKALKELYYARSNFNMVSGAENVELAIYELNLAEKRYQKLLNEARSEIIVDNINELKKRKELLEHKDKMKYKEILKYESNQFGDITQL